MVVNKTGFCGEVVHIQRGKEPEFKLMIKFLKRNIVCLFNPSTEALYTTLYQPNNLI